MSFSRGYRSHQHNNESSCIVDGGRRRNWASGNGYYGNCAVEAVEMMPPLKKRKPSSSSVSTWQQGGSQYRPLTTVAQSGVGGYGNDYGNWASNNLSCNPRMVVGKVENDGSHWFFPIGKNSESVKLAENEDPVFVSRDEIERCSPSRKDGIDVLRETHLRYSYCAFLQNLGMRLELPQTTIGTAMVLCHRFFFRRSHACHDRFVIATATLFLAAKSEETPCPLNNVVRASSEICHKQNSASFPYIVPVDWFENYRERIIEAEQLILTTLDFELNVQHPYTPLASILSKLGLTQTVLVNLAWNLISEGLRSSLWLQFKPHHIAAGAASLAAQFLNFDLSSYHDIWQEFETSPSILQDVVQQLLELL